MTIGLPGMAECAGGRPNSPGGQNGVLVACLASPNCVSSRAAGEGHCIAPLAFGVAPDAAFAGLKQFLVHRSDAPVIEVRSASRPGYSDLGKNRRRIEEIRSRFLATEIKP